MVPKSSLVLVWIALSACSEPGQEAAARQWLLDNGYETTLLTSSEPGVFDFAAIREEKRCRGTLRISTGTFGSTSHMRTCSEDPSEQDLQVECATGRAQSCNGLGLRTMETDPAAGLALFIRACEGGVAAACTNAGVLSARAQPRSGPQAVAYARQGCTSGDTLGCDNLGIYLLRVSANPTRRKVDVSSRKDAHEATTRPAAFSDGSSPSGRTSSTTTSVHARC